MTTTRACDICEHPHAPNLVLPINRFGTDVPVYRANFEGMPTRTTHAEAMADACRELRWSI